MWKPSNLMACKINQHKLVLNFTENTMLCILLNSMNHSGLPSKYLVYIPDYFRLFWENNFCFFSAILEGDDSGFRCTISLNAAA